MKRRSWFVLLVLLAASSAVAQTPPQIKPTKPAFRKLDSQLNRLLSSPVALSQEQIARETPLSQEGRVAVSIRVEGPIEPVRALLESGDAVIANIGEDVIEAYVGLSIMPELDRTPEVTRVRVIIPPQPMVTSQGVAVHNAPNWHTNGFGGAGVRVGIIDTGFIGYSSLIGSELPAPAAVRCYTAVGVFTANIADCQTGSNHGTGVSEAVIDVAPGASLYLAQPQSFSDLLATAQWMAAQGVHVINHSVGWSWDGPGDGTSPFSNSPKVAVQAAVGGGILWVNAAGNSALGSWTGGYSDANGNRFLEFSAGVELNAVQLTAGVPIVAQARWQDSWTAANRDLDIFLLDSVGTPVAGSVEFQEGIPGDIPHEIFGYIPPATGTYYLAIEHFAGSIPSFIQLQVFSGQSLNVRTLSHSIANPAESASPGLLAVGAAAWSSTGVIEPFSSLGPTTDGRVKPDLVGADRGDSDDVRCQRILRYQPGIAARRRPGSSRPAAVSDRHTGRCRGISQGERSSARTREYLGNGAGQPADDLQLRLESGQSDAFRRRRRGNHHRHGASQLLLVGVLLRSMDIGPRSDLRFWKRNIHLHRPAEFLDRVASGHDRRRRADHDGPPEWNTRNGPLGVAQRHGAPRLRRRRKGRHHRLPQHQRTVVHSPIHGWFDEPVIRRARSRGYARAGRL